MCQYRKTSNNKTENILADAFKSIILMLLPPTRFNHALIDIITLFRINERKSSLDVYKLGYLFFFDEGDLQF